MIATTLTNRNACQSTSLRSTSSPRRMASYGFLICLAVAIFSSHLAAQDGTANDVSTPDAKSAGSETLAPEQIEFFESKVRPILVENCYQCHSSTAEDLEAGLMLDSRAGWQRGGDSGPAIVAGKVDESLLIEAIRYEEDVISGMPPRSKLPADKIEILEKWVAMGAPDPRDESTSTPTTNSLGSDLQKRIAEHWSWKPIESPEPPPVIDTAWPVNDIDQFILSRIEQAELRPALDADRRTWLRRVYFDLIGLPPTVDQIEQFLQDTSPDAYQRVVAQLLDSPHFGEKWARHWMDLVRYAETYGHEFDYEIAYAHEYRDYLIRAFNADVPYDQFVREHIAGDLLDPPRRHPTEQFNESIIGTGFWYWHEATHAPTDVVANEADITDNQLDVFGKTFLGLTIACARCHDHKFDAISTADYYALTAYLQSSCRQNVPLDPGRHREQARGQIDRLLAQTRDKLPSVSTDTLVALQPGRYYEVAARLQRQARHQASDKTSSDQPDDAVPAKGKKRRRQKPKEATENVVSGIELATIREAASQEGLDADQLQRWVEQIDQVAIHSTDQPASIPDSILMEDFESGTLPEGWSTSGFAFQAVGSELTPTVDGTFATPGTVDSGVGGAKQVGILRSPTFEIPASQIHFRIKATAGVTIRVIIDNYHMAHHNALLFRGTFLSGKETDTHGRWEWKSLNRDTRKYVGHRAFLEIVDDGNGSIAIDEIRFSNQPAPNVAPSQVTPPHHAAYANEHWRQGVVALRRGQYHPWIASLLDSQLITVDQLAPKAGESIAKAREIADRLPPPRFAVAMTEGTPENAHVFVRGNHATLGEAVPRRFLSALGGKEGTRLDLANQVASPENPLTARVIVNRLWHHLFGRGIVATVDDFGPQGQRPTHPQLLDWLASDLINNDWSLKHAMAQMVLSRTYRQQSLANDQIDPSHLAVTDPTNALLHRMRVRRLPAESIRDAMLLISGRLNATPFGRSVPTHRTPFMTGRGARKSGPLDGDGRRSVYLSIYRNFLNPFMLTFDMPSPFGPKGRRSQSNVPAQALTLMNDPFVVQQAGVWADSILQIPGLTDRQRIDRMVQQAHGHPPSSHQMELMERFLDHQGEMYGERDRRVWADLGHALFNMKAFYYLD